jgi:Ran GTPase-activating protein (RanGAP) involved in mRNA processing and transport
VTQDTTGIIESMKVFLKVATRLIHLDLSGCHYGDNLLEAADEMANAHSLQAVHLSDNDLSLIVIDKIKVKFRVVEDV